MNIISPAEADALVFQVTQVPEAIIDRVNTKIVNDISNGIETITIYKSDDITDPQWFNLQGKLQKMGWKTESVSSQREGTYMRVSRK